MDNNQNPDNPYTNGNNPYMPNQQGQPNPYIPNQQGQPNPYMPNQQGQPNPYMPNQQNAYIPNNQFNPNADMPQFGYHKPISTLTPEENKRANILCGISLFLCFLLPGILMGIYGGSGYDKGGAGYNIFSTLSGLSFIGAWIIAIYVRVRYKENTFGKVLIWVYVSFFILLILGAILMFATCAAIIRDCNY